MTASDEKVAGPPGAILRLNGEGYEGCDRVYAFFDGKRVATIDRTDSGAFEADGVSVPGDASAGRHQLRTSCASSGEPVKAETVFVVTDATVHRSALVTSLPSPNEIALNPKALATTAAIVLAVIALFAFPFELFNTTIEENYDEIRGWFRLPARAVTLAQHPRFRTASFTGLTLAAAGVYGFLSPDFGTNLNSLVILVGTFVALVVMSVIFNVPAGISIYRRFGEKGTLNFLPGSLAISVLMVLGSRVMHFQPGYFYGAMAGLAFQAKLSREDQGRITAANWAFSFVISIAAWLLRTPVAELAAESGANVWWHGLEACLSLIFLWGLEGLAFAMLPMRFLDGRKVLNWSKPIWAVMFGLGLFAVVHVLFGPNSGYISSSASGERAAVVILFGVFGAVSVLLWAWFQFRPERWAPAIVRASKVDSEP